MDLRVVGFGVFVIAAIYFFQHALRQAFRLQSIKADELDAGATPISLGLEQRQAGPSDLLDNKDL